MKKRIQHQYLITFLLLSLSCLALAKDDETALSGISFDGPYDEAVVNGAINVLAQQCDDGGWGWPHNNCDQSFHNIIAPIVDGLFMAYEKSNLQVFLEAAKRAGDFNLGSTFSGNGSPRLGSQTALFLWNLSALSGDEGYKNWARTGFYEALSNGTYGNNGDWDTTEFIDNIRNPPGTLINLRPWEIAYQVLAAERYCYPAIADEFETALLTGIENLDNTNPVTSIADVLGLAGGVLGLANVNRTSFPPLVAPNQIDINGMSTLAELADHLVSLQNPNGSFHHHSNLAAPSNGDESTQTTAYVVLALIKAQERLPENDYLTAITAAKEWLVTMQLADGGFLSSPVGGRNTEVEAEATHALGKEGVYDRIFAGQMECYVN